jgi:hypothetical protein
MEEPAGKLITADEATSAALSPVKSEYVSP